MTDKEIKTFFSGYLEKQREIIIQIEEIEQLERLIEKLENPKKLNIPGYIAQKKKSYHPDSLIPGISLLKNMISETRRKIDSLMKERDQVKETVLSMGNLKYREIIYRKYILGETWEQIGKHMQYDERYMQRLYKKIIESLRAETLPPGV